MKNAIMPPRAASLSAMPMLVAATGSIFRNKYLLIFSEPSLLSHHLARLPKLSSYRQPYRAVWRREMLLNKSLANIS